MFATSLLFAFLGLFGRSNTAVPEIEVAAVTRPCVAARPDSAWEVRIVESGEFTARLYDASGALVAGPCASKRFTVPRADLWSPEDPVLYRLELENAEGVRSAVLPFRWTGLENGAFRLNGRDFPLRALAPGEAAGTEPTEASMREELRAAKAVRANAVTAAYRHDSALWRRICLEEGFFIVGGGVPVETVVCTTGRDRHETAYAARPWSVRETNYFQRVIVRNGTRFTPARGVTLDWTVLKDGVPAARGAFDLRGLRPQSECSFGMPGEAVAAAADGSSVSVRFAFRKGREPLGEDQIDVVASRDLEIPATAGRIGYTESDETFSFATRRAEIAFSRRTGLPVAFTPRRFLRPDRQLLAAGLAPVSALFAGPAVPTVREISPVDERAGRVTFKSFVDWTAPASDGRTVLLASVFRWTVFADGTLACDAAVQPLPGSDFAAAGLALGFSVPGADTEVRWFGRGPWEHRAGDAAAFLGLWTRPGTDFADADDPAATGLRTDTRGFAAGGIAVRTLASPFDFTARPEAESDSLRLAVFTRPAADGRLEFRFTMAPDDGPLSARAFDRSPIPDFPERPATDTNDTNASNTK